MLRRIPVKVEVSFVNLIDVTLVLLIIFMITAPTMHHMMEVDLPSAKTSAARISEGIVVTINSDGILFIDREKISMDEFSQRFEEVLKKRSGEPVYVNADRKAVYGTITDVIGTVKSLGIENVGLVIEESAQTKSNNN